MSDERPEDNGAPRFGRRPRQGNVPQNGSDPQAPKPKVRIGPRRPEAPPASASPSPPRDPLKPQGGVRKPGDRFKPREQGAGQPRPDQQQGNKRKKRNKNKFRRNDGRDPRNGNNPGEPRPQGDAAQGDMIAGQGAPGEGEGFVPRQGGGAPQPGQGRNARRRKRRKDRREVVKPSEGDVFEPVGTLEMPSIDDTSISFEEDESDLNVIEMPPPSARGEDLETDFDDGDDDDGDDETDMEPPSDMPVEGGEAAPPGQQRESRSKRRRKKRRERMEAGIVDRASGFWWADQWTRSFEILYGGGASRARLQKGRSYSRRGQVTDLEVGPNGVIARVQGSRPKPYQVRVELNRLRRETWGRILHQLAGKAAFLAQLLDGTLPPEIEDVFFDAGARLFPHGDGDIRSRCTCPDPVVPCKHVSAVHYALAEALQRDPFLLFALRGKSRDQFLQDLRDMRGRDGSRREPVVANAEDLSKFWRMGRLAESVLRPTGWGSGGDPARLVQSLGEPQLEGIREGLFLPMLESTYRQVSEGMRRLPKDG